MLIVWLKCTIYLAWLEESSFCELKLMNFFIFFIVFVVKSFCRLEVLMCYTATMPMEKKMIIFKGVVIGCLNSEYGPYNVASLWNSSLFIFHIFFGPLLYFCVDLLLMKKPEAQN